MNIPPQRSVPPSNLHGGVDLPRKVGFWGAVAVMVGVMIGSGIFRVPSAIAMHLGDPWVILLMWLAGGLIALCGALTFAELVSQMPRSGGIYVFLKEGFGDCTAFVFGWTFMLITKPAAAGGIIFISVENLNALTGWGLDVPWTACAGLFVLTLINVLGVKGSTRFAMVLTAVKYAALAGIVLVGVWAAVRGGDGGGGFVRAPAPKALLDAIVPVMAAVMWTYDGWSDVGAIAGEVKKPERTLPRVYIVGTLGVTAVYLLVNAVYLWFVPLAEMTQTDNVARLLMERIGGPGLAAAVTVVVILSALGSSHASVMTGARVTFAQARDGLLFRFLGRIHPRFETPATALWMQLGLSCLCVLVLQDFAKLAETFVFTMWIFYGMGAVAIFIVRRKRAGEARAFSTPGYPVVPLVFIASSVGMTVLSIRADPKTTLVWLGVLAAGVPVYFLWRKMFPATV